MQNIIQLTSSMDAEYIERFWANVLKRSDGHWIWQGAKTAAGYGKIMINRKQIQATQLSYAIANNKELSDIENLKMVKICDYSLCVNPAHLVALPKKKKK